MKAKISVVIPFYNAAETLDKAIKSIAEQSCSNFECILVNNNSKDKSLEIAWNWAERDSRFRVTEEIRQGVMFASNKGFNEATGKYLARMDADDYAFPDRLKLQSDFLDNNPEYEVISSLVEYVPYSAKIKGISKYVEWVNSVQTYTAIKNQRFIDSPVVNPSAMWRKETGEQYGHYRSGDFPEDYEMWLRWLEKGVKITKIPEYLLKWVDSENRLTRSHQIYRDDAFYSIKTYYLARWLKKNNPFHPNVWIWGASKISRKRARLLENYKITIMGFIDIKDTRQIKDNLIHYRNIPSPEEIFLLIYVRQWDAKEKIKKFLTDKGFKEGWNYLMIS